MAGSRARRLRRQKHQQGNHQPGQLQESTTYSELLATTIPANSNQNADKVAQTLGIVQNVSYPSSTAARDVAPGEADAYHDGELASKLESKSRLGPAALRLRDLPLTSLTSDTALYHAAIKPDKNQSTTKMAAQSKEADASNKGKQQSKTGDQMAESDKKEGKKPEVVTTTAVSTNRNCAVTIWNLPDGTTEPMVLEAIAEHKPLGNIYACDVYVIPGPNNVPPAMPVASVRFMRPEPAARLVQAGNRPEGQGISVGGRRARIALAHRPQPACLSEPASRVVVFRGPRAIVNPAALRRLWGFKEQTERLVIGEVDQGVCEIEWRFCSYAYNAEPAFCVFEDVYGKREDCSVRYGVDPCA